MAHDYAIHSDLLIHWTGKEIDDDDDGWRKHDKTAENDSKFDGAYLQRLRDILKYGLWMKLGSELCPNRTSGTIPVPEHPRTCFTELKLSECRRHARRYGRMGIGVKRKFLFERGGRPVIYYGPAACVMSDVFLDHCATRIEDKTFLQYFKSMDDVAEHPFNYDYYAESEWRIVHTKEGCPQAVEPTDECLHTISQENRAKVKYLLPLDAWLSCIIYPSVSIKHKAIADPAIRSAIEEIKQRGNAIQLEKDNWPVEIDLDLCQNF